VTRRIPAITLVLGFLSLAVFGRPDLFDQFVYNRQAVLQGEIWRIFSAPLAHFSVSQLFWDLLVFSAFGCVLENLNKRIFLGVLVLTAAFCGLFYLIFLPDLAYYGGISGIATGVVAYLCLRQLTCSKNTGLWHVAFAFLIIKISVEVMVDKPVFVLSQNPGFILLPSAHLIGLGVALFVWVFEMKLERYANLKQVMAREN